MTQHGNHFRWRDQQFIAGGAGALGAVYFFVSAYYSFQESLSLVMFDLIVGAVWTTLAIRSARAGAVTTEDGLEVRNILRTFHISWPDVVHFELGALRLVHRPVAVVRLKDGTTVPLGSFLAPVGTSLALKRIQRMVEGLNAEKEHWRRLQDGL